MNPDQENFDELLKLLALKKYEQPPPRYFTDLPSKIWSRIEREESVTPFWRHLLPDFAIRPSWAYSFGLLACGAMVFGIGYSLKTDTNEAIAQPVLEDIWPTRPQLAQEGPTWNISNFQPVQSSTNPMLDTESLPSLFDGLKLQAAPVSYPVGQ